jgi:hypothetical protein
MEPGAMHIQSSMGLPRATTRDDITQGVPIMARPSSERACINSIQMAHLHFLVVQCGWQVPAAWSHVFPTRSTN